MHGMDIKIISAQQAGIHNIYKKVKLNLLKTNPAIWFNKMCRTKRLTHNDIHIKVSDNNPQSKAILYVYFINSVTHNFS